VHNLVCGASLIWLDAGSARLPLGMNSSFLEAALEVGMIGTKQWSLWTGNPDRDIDGLFILGGYDEARVAGEFTAFDVDQETKSPYVQVTGIAWETINQDSIDLMPNASQAVWALPEPRNYYVGVPGESYLKFLDATNSSGKVIYNSTSGWVNFPTIPDGDFVVTLNNGMKTTIPAKDLFLHPQDYDSNGVMQNSNDSYYVDRLMPQINPSSALYLGLPFMNQKMFVADWDAGKFYMADAVKDEQTTTNVRPLCTSSTTVPPSPPPSPSPHPDSGPNIPAIAGGVGGGVGGLILIGLIAWFVLRKKKNAQEQATPEVSEPPYQVSSPPPKYATSSVHPVSDPRESYFSPPPQHIPPQEMASPLHSPPQQVASPDYWNNHPAGPGNHREKRVAAISGPLEMPADYDERFTTGE